MYELHPEVQAQLVVRSIDSTFVIAFPKSKSKNFQAALSLAKLADSFEELKDGDSLYFLSSYTINLKNVSLIKAIIDLSLNWKGVHIFLNGQPINRVNQFSDMLGCYRNSFRAVDKQAFCSEILEDIGEPPNTDPVIVELRLVRNENGELSSPKKKDSVKWIHPCKFMANFYYHLDKRHPSTLQDQLQAQAIKFNCDICPNFNSNNLRIL